MPSRSTMMTVLLAVVVIAALNRVPQTRALING